jgi:hypothetical protein
MLAYVFWHWPNGDHVADEYERLQRAFHAALAQAAPAGFHGSFVFRVDGKAPWLHGEPAYADWYLVENSAALDPLNVAAVSGVCEQPHAEVARAMAAGAGSLFALHGDRGPANLGTTRHVTWLTKPRSMPYDTFYATVASLPDAAQTSLWRRQMVLGPTTEFALLSATSLTVPDTFAPLFLSVSPIWPDR